MREDQLYEKGQVKVTYLHSPEPGEENKIISGEDHELWMEEKGGEYDRFILQKGILSELSDGARNGPLSLLKRLRTIDERILDKAYERQITLTDLGNAFISAYQKELDDFEAYLSEQQRIGK